MNLLLATLKKYNQIVTYIYFPGNHSANSKQSFYDTAVLPAVMGVLDVDTTSSEHLHRRKAYFALQSSPYVKWMCQIGQILTAIIYFQGLT